jgi:Na+/melibiose symporter-like transporter
VVDSILDFSKHLLLTLIAILAFTAAIGANAKLFLTSVLLILAIIFVMISAFFCYKAFEVVIDSKMKQESYNNEKQKNKAPLTDKAKKSLFWKIRLQFFTSLLSLVLIGAMVVFETIGFTHDSGLCAALASNEWCESTYGYRSLPSETRLPPQSEEVDALLLNLLAKMKAI